MSLHKEINFESDFCNHLATTAGCMRPATLQITTAREPIFPKDVLAWVQETQPKAWETLVKNHGTSAGETLLDRLRESLDKSGTLDVLRHGIDLLGLRESMMMRSSDRRWRSIPTSWPATGPTGCASFDKYGIRCTTRIASTSCYFSTAYRWRRLK